MRKLVISILAAALSVVAVSTVEAQTPGRADRSRATSQRKSDSSAKGPNAAFKNQQRKMTDPLNANGR